MLLPLLVIKYFWDRLRLFYQAQLDKRYRDPNNWQDVIKQAIDAKAKAGQQSLSLLWKSNAHYFRSYKQIKGEEFQDKKDSETKKTSHNTRINNSRNGCQLSD